MLSSLNPKVFAIIHVYNTISFIYVLSLDFHQMYLSKNPYVAHMIEMKCISISRSFSRLHVKQHFYVKIIM